MRTHHGRWTSISHESDITPIRIIALAGRKLLTR